MSNSTTRIADLPENIKFDTSDIGPNIQMNPNPNSIPLPQDTQMRNQFIPTKEQQEMMIPSQPHTLPSRDIPIDQNIYQQDVNVQPNHIPPPKYNDDYLQSYENYSLEHFPNYDKLKYRETLFDSIFREIQLPMFIGTLYFIFNLPIFDKFIMKYFSFLNLYYDDGNSNLYGIIIKSIVFSSVFFSLNKTIDYLTII